MKRDKKLILRLLRYIRDNYDGGSAMERPPDVNGRDTQETAYHICLCISAGFLDGDIFTTHIHGRGFRAWGLTWKGHDYLEENADC